MALVNRPAAAELKELLEASYNLPNATCDLGRVQLGLPELQQVLKTRTPGGIKVDAKAHYLLAGSGFNAEQVQSEISMLRFSIEQDHSRPVGFVNRGVEGYLSSKKSDNVFASIDSLVQSSTRDFDSFVAQKLALDWRGLKQQIQTMLGMPVGAAASAVAAAAAANQTADLTSYAAAETTLAAINWGRRRVGRLLLGEATTEMPDPATMQRARDFAAVVGEINDSWQLNKPLNVARRFAEVSAAYEVASSPQLNDTWRAIELLAGPQPTRRQFAKQYLSSQPGEQTRMRQLITFKSKEYLEQQYRAYIEGEIDSHRHEANLGGIPSSYNKVKAFVALKYLRNDQWDSRIETINKTPIWAQLYYLVRAGYLKEASQLVLERNDIFESVESTFAAYFTAYFQSPDHMLSEHYREMIHTEYAQLFRPGAVFDPFKQALYKIIGRCELQRSSLPQVAVTTEDWLWLQLALVREATAGTELRNDRYDLSDLQRVVLETGAEHFEPTGLNPGKFFGLQILVGLYENAVEFLYKSHELYAVHYAITLASYGLLRPDDTPDLAANDSSVPPPADTKSFDFAGAVGRYTRSFRGSEPEVAVDYLVLIALSADSNPAQLGLCHETLQELILETRKFPELVGDAQDGGPQGAIDARRELIGLADKKKYLHVIAYGSAVKADDDGRVLDAILLYHLAECDDKVLQMVNHALGQTLASAELGQPLASTPGDPLVSGFTSNSDPVQLARNLLRLQQQNMGVRPETTASTSSRRQTTATLLLIAEAIDLLAEKRYSECVARLNDSGILILSPTASIAEVREHALQFSRYDESVARNIPNVLVIAMECCVALVKSLRGSHNPASQDTIAQHRRWAANCMIYAGLLQYRMPRQVYTRLTQLELGLSQ